MPRSRLTPKGQITVPKELREHLGLQTGDRVNFEIRDAVVVMARRSARPVTLQEMEAAIRKGASRVDRRRSQCSPIETFRPRLRFTTPLYSR